VLLSTLALAGLGCSKDKTSAGDAPGVAAAQATSSPSAQCAGKLESLNAKATADEKKAYATACSAVSSTAQTCIASAKVDKDIDACLSSKADKDAFMGAVLGAALKAGAAASAGMHTTKLDKLGLQIDVPGETMVSDGLGPKSVMVNATSIGGLTIGEASAGTAKTLKAAKSEAQMFKPKNVQGEQTADGYWLTFENTGSMGTNYWVKSVRQIGGKTYTCEGAPDSADKESAAVAACKSLRP
jgi:hypothetical protein